MKELASFEQVDQIRRTDPEAYRRMLCWDYAYNVGYRHRVVGSSRSARGRSLVADPCDGRSARSPRLSRSSVKATAPITAGAVRTCSSATAASAGSTREASAHATQTFISTTIEQPRPGVHVLDSVLMPSKTPFGGR